jgi:hypothetical protein
MLEDAKQPVVPVVMAASPENDGGGKKRWRRRQPKRGCDSATEEKDEAVKLKQSGFRHHGSRRKSTPRRAADAGVECK